MVRYFIPQLRVHRLLAAALPEPIGVEVEVQLPSGVVDTGFLEAS